MMSRKIVLFFLCAFLTHYGWAQSMPADTARARKNLLDVLFATNDDCELSVYGQFEGTVARTEHKQLKLAPGNYTYKAVSKSGTDQVEESFTVSDKGLNEIFIDLLYVRDQNLQGKEPEKKPLEKPIRISSPPGEVQEETRLGVKTPAGVVDRLLRNMVLVTGGSFVMGNNKAPAEDEAEHTVTVNSFYFSKYEVTQEQWETIIGSNPSENKGCPTCPVENISWEEAMIFIKKLNEVSNKRFRLPKEAEWEYVARFGGKQEIDSVGGQEEYIKTTAWFFANSDKRTHPVGQKLPNTLGVYDLFGNVSEWCFDWYSPDYFKKEKTQKDPEGPPLGKEKLVRGGSFMEYLGDRFRPSLRQKLKPTTKSKELGLRLVREAS